MFLLHLNHLLFHVFFFFCTSDFKHYLFATISEIVWNVKTMGLHLVTHCILSNSCMFQVLFTPDTLTLHFLSFFNLFFIIGSKRLIFSFQPIAIYTMWYHSRKGTPGPSKHVYICISGNVCTVNCIIYRMYLFIYWMWLRTWQCSFITCYWVNSPSH